MSTQQQAAPTVPAHVNIRTARPEEYERIGQLTAAAYVQGGHLPASDPYMLELADTAARAELTTVLVAVLPDGSVAASATLTEYGAALAEVARPGEMEFRMLAVAPEHQGKGIARMLVRHIISIAEAREDISGIAICSLRSMTSAHALYRSEGFVTDPARDFHLQLPGKTMSFPFFLRKV
ncbi:GNAT family N-acetyltransferase [Nesterenkonia flava]|uniref:GNAT family N-acetyltransferase n=1 Tax=Nesterenkonia flava TaxID=469799 RepID=A0ABU1FT77_9MICC|nr:GNAT family N-acetyltransferase [Nesterenkonia flava]MDR5711868.1 GNAT family N-acetyltransferase [Nesterenkonia flava]